jgi:excinuclease ABC subunit C
MGEANVGAMVVFKEDKFVKSAYRNYNLQATTEYEQMKELLSKRAQSFAKNPPPDLWLIDGGEALRRLAVDIINSVGANVEVVAISKEKVDSKAYRAKGGARDIIYTKDDVFKFDSKDRVLQFLQKIRDEAHRCAISFHRKQKLKQDKQISLLQIKGIAKAKVKKLLNYFGSFENIKNASLQELSMVLNSSDAKKIQEFFKNYVLK